MQNKNIAIVSSDMQVCQKTPCFYSTIIYKNAFKTCGGLGENKYYYIYIYK